MFTEIFRENASFEGKIREIKQVLTLLQNNVISEQCEIPSAPKYWCYVLLPGRIGLKQWGALIAAGYRCLTHPDGYQFTIVLSAEELFSAWQEIALIIIVESSYF